VSADPRRPRPALAWSWCAALGAALLLFALSGCHRKTVGEELYDEHCSNCHGIDGAGNTALGMGHDYADLLDDRWKYGGDDTSIAGVIRDGSFGSMPAFREQLTEEQIRAIVGHLRTLRGERPPDLKR
jgi:cbb3-type cytochrome c oxidase subunit III